MDAPRREPMKAITVRVPESQYEVLRDYSESHEVSLNMVVADAIAEHTVRLERQAVLDDIAAFQKRLGKTTEPTSVEDLRQIRRSRTAQIAPETTKGDARK